MKVTQPIVDKGQDDGRMARVRVVIARSLAPRWRWFSLGALIVVGICIRLSAWQFDRLAERTAATASAAERAESPPVSLDAHGTLDDLVGRAPTDLGDLVMRRATVRGVYDHEHDEALTMQVVDGRLGVRLLSPLRAVGSESAVLVDRGWLPIDYDRPIKWIPFRVEGTVTIEGRLRPGHARVRPKTSEDLPGLLPELDLDQVAARLPYPLLRLLLVEAPAFDVSGVGSLPIRQELKPPQAELPHLAYAVQWLAFALIVAGGYVGLVITDATAQGGIPRVRVKSPNSSPIARQSLRADPSQQ